MFIFGPYDHEIKWTNWKKNRASPLMLCQALFIISKPSVNSNCSYSPGMLNLSKIGNFLSCVTLKFDVWPWKTIEHLFYSTSSFVHHFVAISQFKQELLSGNAHLRSKSQFLIPCDLEIWWMALQNYRAPLLCYFKICASFHNHRWIQTWVTVRKCPIWVKIGDFWSRMTSKFDGWPWNTIGHLF